ncbi:MAG: alpha/beta fold hydrolase [Gammaproteobacteria bacterium]|nr:alpha/beta fold hydrolase [Gammaproteobacteria bacterium]
MAKSVLLVAGVSIGLYVALCLYAYTRQRALLYHPTPAVQRDDLASLYVESDGVRVQVWVAGARAGDPAAAALVYFGGNAEDTAGSIDTLAAALPGRVLYLVNYRNYGGSSGTPTERGLLADSEAVYDTVRARHPAGRIAVMGRSLGAGVAVHLAAVRSVDRLVLVTPYDSMVAVAREHFGWLPVSLLVRDGYDARATVLGGRVRAPTLIVIAVDDEVVPARRGEALAAAFPGGQASVLRIAGATHNSIDLFPQYLETVGRFL